MTPQEFATRACRALPERIKSIVLFGSAAAGDFIEGVSGFDLLIVLEPLGLDELEALAPLIRDWHKAGHPLPLLFTSAQLQASTDAFAIEFLELQHDRRVVYGPDPMVGLKIDPAHARMHLERELKGKLLALRDQYVLAAGDPRRIEGLLCRSLSSFLSLFRAAVALYQPQVPSRKLDALEALAQHIPFDPQPFRTVGEIKAGHRAAGRMDLRDLFRSYWQSIETVTNAVDRLLHAT